MRQVKFLLVLIVLAPLTAQSQVNPDSIIISNFVQYFDSTSSQGVNVEHSLGYVLLKTSEDENLAKKRKATITYYGTGAPRTGTGDIDTIRGNPMKVIDGDVKTFCEIRPGGEGTYILIDLMAIRRINKVVIVTFGGNTPLRPRAYTIYAGTDSLQLTRILQKTDNLDVKTLDVFDPILARFVKVSFDVVDKFSSTVISEIEVYGVGYLSSGSYVSKVIDAGKPVNWGWVEWDAELPEGTNIGFRFRTGSSSTIDNTWSQWSDEITRVDILKVPEPKRYVQFMANLSTASTETPVLRKLSIFYNKELVAKNISIEVEPQVAPILKKVDISCNFDLEMDENSLGMDTLLIFTPSPAKVEAVTLNGGQIPYSVVSTPEYVKIAFPQPIRASSRLTVKLSLTLYLDVNEFPSVAISKFTPNNPQFVEAKSRGSSNSWTVYTTDVPEKLIVDLQLNPNPFSPNGDGLNDKVQISFFLANLAVERTLEVQVFDLTGKLIKTIYDGPSKAFAYISSSSFAWDGRDDSGKVVRPGVYLLRIAINADSGIESVFKTITVVY